MMRNTDEGDPKRRRGAVVVFVAVSMITLLLFAALAIDVGWICTLCAEMQNTADAGALAGAIALREEDNDAAIARAYEILGRNLKELGYGSLDDQVVELGIWDSAEQKFTPLDPAEWNDAFAVRVRARWPEAPLFFAAIAKHYQTDVWRDAVAVGSGPCEGIWGLEGVVAGSVHTDSYNSTEGPYDEDTAYENGDICSGRGVTIIGSKEIEGEVMAGFGYGVTVNGGAGYITGMTSSNLMGIAPPGLDPGDLAYTNDNATIGLTDKGVSPWKKTGWALDMAAGDRLVIPPGEYYLDSIRLTGGSSIVITGKTTIYVTGSIDTIGGTFVNEAASPGDLTVFGLGEDVKISGGSGFYGAIVAPNAEVTLAGNDVGFHGAVIGETVKLIGDFDFHVDESLVWTKMFTPPPPMLVR
jgi:hypothetical protein